MEQKSFKEWSKEDVRAWAEGFIGATEANKLFDNDMSGLSLSHAQTQDLKDCGLTSGKSLEVLAKVAEQLGTPARGGPGKEIGFCSVHNTSVLLAPIFLCTPKRLGVSCF
jgi:hypothetical protein